MPGGWTEPNKDKEKIAHRLNNIIRKSLTDILNEFGYKTAFHSPHPMENILNEMLRV